jgi:hypothetical protein
MSGVFLLRSYQAKAAGWTAGISSVAQSGGVVIAILRDYEVSGKSRGNGNAKQRLGCTE